MTPVSARSARFFLCSVLACLVSLTALGAEDTQQENNAFLLMNVHSSGPLSVRDLEFTNLDTEQTILIRDIAVLGRVTRVRFLLEELPAGSYYLSAIYPTHNRIDASPPIKLDSGSGVFTILEGAINYIGDLTVRTEQIGQRISTQVSYEAESDTLILAVNSEREKFASMPTFVTIADYDPVPVDPKLLGL
ncbi:MAG: hypothetical protein O2971_20195 [Proteobacteria bacterium]|nr:hypothetical protein [Pseudomonadota bacterium]